MVSSSGGRCRFLGCLFEVSLHSSIKGIRTRQNGRDEALLVSRSASCRTPVDNRILPRHHRCGIHWHHLLGRERRQEQPLVDRNAATLDRSVAKLGRIEAMRDRIEATPGRTEAMHGPDVVPLVRSIRRRR